MSSNAIMFLLSFSIPYVLRINLNGHTLSPFTRLSLFSIKAQANPTIKYSHTLLSFHLPHIFRVLCLNQILNVLTPKHRQSSIRSKTTSQNQRSRIGAPWIKYGFEFEFRVRTWSSGLGLREDSALHHSHNSASRKPYEQRSRCIG